MREWRRLLGRVLLLLAVFGSGYLGARLGLLHAPMAQASHNFSDVLTGVFYHDFVQFLVDNDITAGCAPGLFCGEDPVTRGQMAVFLKKLSDVVDHFRMTSVTASNSIQVTGGAGETTILSLTFDVPAGKTADILAFFNGQLTHASTTPVGLCFGVMKLDSTSGPELPPGEMLLLDGGVLVDGGAVHAVAASLQAQQVGIGPGTHTLFVRANTGGQGCFYGQRSLFVIANLQNA